MKAAALGDAVAHLAWLSPASATLVALARAPAAGLWHDLRDDPGAVVLLLRHAGTVSPLPGLSFYSSLGHDPAILEGALRHLEQPEACFVDWNLPAVRPAYEASLAFARVARALAEKTERAVPDNAWAAGLLAPLGWLAVCAIDPDSAAACLAVLPPRTDGEAVQQQCWGLDASAIARRLSRQWRLPAWLALGHLDLPVTTAQRLGAEPNLFRIVQLAVGLVQRYSGRSLGLALGATPAELAAALGLSSGELDEIIHHLDAWLEPPPARAWESPQRLPLLRDLMRLAVENRRLAQLPRWEQLERYFDQLHRAVRQQLIEEEGRLRASKLSALAEFAAGAGHEINNPLAVISGQAQYLLLHDAEPARQKALQTIIAQTHRIHTLLNELMQFARPPRLQKERVDLGILLAEVAQELHDLAAQRQVQLLRLEPEEPIYAEVDPRLVRMAMMCLLRNAVEAAPAEGWARIRLEAKGLHQVDCIVEDSGTGPSLSQREHLFDPFYSGRQAGRGHGLGLPSAWRFAHEHGGDVRFEPLAEGPTRFVMSLPRNVETNGKATSHAGNGNGQPLLRESTASLDGSLAVRPTESLAADTPP